MIDKPLFVFDLDGTLTNAKGEIPSQIFRGIAQLWESGFETTILTGRGYLRMLEALKGQLNRIIGPGPQLIGLEQGARISTSNGKENMHYQSFSEEELQAIVRSVSPFDIDFIGFFPEKPLSRSIIWTNNSQNEVELRKRYAHNADVVFSPVEQLYDIIATANPCMVTLKTYLNNYAEYIDPLLNFYNGGKTINILPKQTDKGQALMKIAQLKKARHISIAADDFNDLPMLNLPNLNLRVIVGKKITQSHLLYTEGLVFVDNTEGLGEYLSSIHGV